MLGRILLSLPSYKMGLIKNFIEAMNTVGKSWSYSKNKFLRISNVKTKHGTFSVPQTMQLMKDAIFSNDLGKSEIPACRSFKTVITNFFRNEECQNHKEVVDELVHNQKNKIECRYRGKWNGSIFAYYCWRTHNEIQVKGEQKSDF